MKSEPKFSRNQKVEFMLRDDSAKSGFTHHCGYVKRTVREGILRKRWMYYICQASKDERFIWKVPEKDILGVVEYKEKAAPTKEQLNELQNKFNRQY